MRLLDIKDIEHSRRICFSSALGGGGGTLETMKDVTWRWKPWGMLLPICRQFAFLTMMLSMLTSCMSNLLSICLLKAKGLNISEICQKTWRCYLILPTNYTAKCPQQELYWRFAPKTVTSDYKFKLAHQIFEAHYRDPWIMLLKCNFLSIWKMGIIVVFYFKHGGGFRRNG